MTIDLPLDVLQRWMQSVITDPQGVSAGILSAAAQREIPLEQSELSSVVSPSQRCTSLERLRVYADAYFARLLECLEADYPAFRSAVGPEAFANLIAGYLERYPPRADNLSQLGRWLADDLSATCPPRETGESPDWIDFLIDVVRVERLYTEVFDGPGEESLPPLQFSDLAGIRAEEWPRARLITSSSLRLVMTKFPVHRYISQVRSGDSAVPPPPEQTRLAIHRREYIVRRQPLEEVPFRLLGALQRGLPLASGIEEALSLAERPSREVEGELHEWFRAWAGSGVLIGVEIAGD